MACLALACGVLGALGGAVPAPRPQRGTVRPDGTRWPPLQARDRSGAHPGGLERQKEVELARCDRLQLCCCITLPLLRTFPLHAQRHDSR